MIMKSKNKKRFFKLIMGQPSFFAGEYGIDCPEDIYPDQVFAAKGTPRKWCIWEDKQGFAQPKVCLWNEKPLIHFCDNVVDMLMWYWVGLDDIVSYREVYFYEVIPCIPYYKERCIDDNNLFQCGATHIRIKKQLSTGDVMRIALSEINKNPDEIINRYPDLNMLKYMMRIRESVIQK